MRSILSVERKVILSLTAAVTAMLILTSMQTSLFAQDLNLEDYMITGFGMINSNTPFITVQGKAGGSFDASIGDEGYQAYVFKTDKGNFMITVARGAGTTPYYSAERLLTDDLQLNACLITEQAQAEPRLQGHTAILLGRNLDLTSLIDVYAIQVASDIPDNTCKSGDHLSKIVSYMTGE
jgi:hypothetical protein